MIVFLGRILATLLGIAESVTAGIIAAVNLILVAIGLAIAGILGLLPEMPDVPDPPAVVATASGYIAYFIPTTTILAYAAFLVGVWVSFLVYRVILKIVRAM